MSLNDQFEYGRIPLKPLPYKNKELAQCNEFVIDYGDDGTYHMYITDSEDPTKFIDLTSKIIREILPNAKIDANQFQINIEGVEDPSSLKDIINFIYKRFTYPENINGFDPSKDADKILDPTTKQVLLRNTDGTILLPVTSASNVIDTSGTSVQERLDNMTYVAFSTQVVRATENNQMQFTLEFPYKNYDGHIEIIAGNAYLDKSRYTINYNLDDNGDYYTAELLLVPDINDYSDYYDNRNYNSSGIERGRKLVIIYIYNAVPPSQVSITNDSSKTVIKPVHGSIIANKSIASIKLEKTTDSYTLNDSSAIATAAAVNNAYTDIINKIYSNNAIILAKQTTVNADTINVSVNTTSSYVIFMMNVLITSNITVSNPSDIAIKVQNNNTTFSLRNMDGTKFATNTIFPAGKIITLICDTSSHIAYLNTTIPSRKTFKYICEDKERVIPYTGLSYNANSIINIYRNGVRLFEDLDYTHNRSNETITLMVYTESEEIIIFEAISY